MAMPRTIKRVSHDLLPLSKGNSELSALISKLLLGIESHISFDDPRAKSYFDKCLEATEKMMISARLIQEYVVSLDKEAEAENIPKD